MVWNFGEKVGQFYQPQNLLYQLRKHERQIWHLQDLNTECQYLGEILLRHFVSHSNDSANQISIYIYVDIAVLIWNSLHNHVVLSSISWYSSLNKCLLLQPPVDQRFGCGMSRSWQKQYRSLVVCMCCATVYTVFHETDE